MSGIGWHIFTFSALGVALLLLFYRTVRLVRLPLHLRWELAPIPHEKGKSRYGGSYLEEYEWWRHPHRKSFFGPIFYMAQEILLLRAIWRHNRGLWPLTFALHTGIYLIILMLALQALNAIFVATNVPPDVLGAFRAVAAAAAAAGYLLGAAGVIGLILKRALDADLRPFSSVARYVNLVFLLAVFVSGAYAFFTVADFSAEVSLFIKGLFSGDAATGLSAPLAAHAIILILFALYLPFTGMIHFVAKYFTYHEIRWNDTPLDKEMEGKLGRLMGQPVTWSAAHAGADRPKSWTETAAGEGHEKAGS